MKTLLFYFCLVSTVYSNKWLRYPNLERQAYDPNAPDDDELYPDNGFYLPLINPNNHQLRLNGTIRKYFTYNAILSSANKNIVCSPLTALLPLAKLFFGTLPHGLALRQILKAIGVRESKLVASSTKKLLNDLGYLPAGSLTIASQIFVPDGAKLNDTYVKRTTKVFKTTAALVSYTDRNVASGEINQWVKDMTNGQLYDVIMPAEVGVLPSVIMVNAIHFMGRWKYPFIRLGVKELFYSLDKKDLVTMMRRSDVYNYAKSEELAAEMVEIPFKTDSASFVIVLPESRTGLAILLQKLKDKPKLINTELGKMIEENVQITIPKFIIQSKLDLAKLYAELGLSAIFDTKSGIVNMVENTHMYVTSAVQSSLIEVDEEGTHSSSSAGLFLHPAVGFPNYVNFTADHPFLFYVIANGEQLFSGTLNWPSMKR